MKQATAKAPRARDAEKDTPTAGRGPNGDDLKLRIPYMLRAANAAVMREAARAFAPFNLRPSQFACLLVIHSEPGLKQQRVGELLGVKHSNLISIIDQLESRGLVKRTRLAMDRRANALKLTAKGGALVEEVRRADNAHHRRLAEAVGEDRVPGLLRALTRLSTLE